MFGVAHAFRMLASAFSRSRTFFNGFASISTEQNKKKIVSARRRNQHARRVRYPENARRSAADNAEQCLNAALGEAPALGEAVVTLWE